MPVSKKTFGVEFSRSGFWGCIESSSRKAWDKVFKEDSGFVTKAKWLRLCKELYKIVVQASKNDGNNKIDSHRNGLNTLWTFVDRTPQIMFPKARALDLYWDYDITKALVKKNGEWRGSFDPVLKSLSARFDKLQKLELKLRKEQK